MFETCAVEAPPYRAHFLEPALESLHLEICKDEDEILKVL